MSASGRDVGGLVGYVCGFGCGHDSQLVSLLSNCTLYKRKCKW